MHGGNRKRKNEKIVNESKQKKLKSEDKEKKSNIFHYFIRAVAEEAREEVKKDDKFTTSGTSRVSICEKDISEVINQYESFDSLKEVIIRVFKAYSYEYDNNKLKHPDEWSFSTIRLFHNEFMKSLQAGPVEVIDDQRADLKDIDYCDEMEDIFLTDSFSSTASTMIQLNNKFQSPTLKSLSQNPTNLLINQQKGSPPTLTPNVKTAELSGSPVSTTSTVILPNSKSQPSTPKPLSQSPANLLTNQQKSSPLTLTPIVKAAELSGSPIYSPVPTVESKDDWPVKVDIQGVPTTLTAVQLSKLITELARNLVDQAPSAQQAEIKQRLAKNINSITNNSPSPSDKFS